jgi:dimethylargininase
MGHAMLTAFTRKPSPQLQRCHLTHLARQPIDLRKARAQHRDYEFLLGGLQVQVCRLPPAPQQPDGVFVQDTALVCDELAVTAPLVLPSRQAEAESTLTALALFRDVALFTPPATFDGGDVLIAEREAYVGLTGRTNRAAFEQIRQLLERDLGEYRVRPVRVEGCVHLKSGCSYIGRGVMVINRRWVDAKAFPGFQCIDVPADEPFGANTLTVHDTVIVSASCPRTADAISRAGFSVLTVDISEFEKAEGGVSCLSLLFQVVPALIAERFAVE